jgi:hypothetical protein
MNQPGGWIEISPVTSLLRACRIGAGLSQCANGSQCLPEFSSQNDTTLRIFAAPGICPARAKSGPPIRRARRTLRHAAFKAAIKRLVIQELAPFRLLTVRNWTGFFEAASSRWHKTDTPAEARQPKVQRDILHQCNLRCAHCYFRGSIGTIPETAETENTRSYQGGLWLMRQSAANPSARQIPCDQGI